MTPSQRNREIVLLVEDHPQLREMATDMLVDFGFEVLAAASVAAATAILDGEAREIAFVLSDFELQDGTALEVLRSARARHNAIPAVVMSGWPRGASTPELLFIFLEKPFDDGELRAAIRRARG